MEWRWWEFNWHLFFVNNNWNKLVKSAFTLENRVCQISGIWSMYILTRLSTLPNWSFLNFFFFFHSEFWLESLPMVCRIGHPSYFKMCLNMYQHTYISTAFCKHMSNCWLCDRFLKCFLFPVVYKSHQNAWEKCPLASWKHGPCLENNRFWLKLLFWFRKIENYKATLFEWLLLVHALVLISGRFENLNFDQFWYEQITKFVSSVQN